VVLRNKKKREPGRRGGPDSLSRRKDLLSANMITHSCAKGNGIGKSDDKLDSYTRISPRHDD
jgi:hypothetical protein